MKAVKILLVEDNEGDILLTREALEEGQVPFELSVVRDGHEAIRFLAREGTYADAIRPDFVLLDINLPKKNGHEVLKFIKSDIELRKIPVIMLTTSSARQDIQKSYDGHANCYVIKPIEVNSFLEVIGMVEKFWGEMVQLPSKQ
jgi:CheY-like chemotaxis protein